VELPTSILFPTFTFPSAPLTSTAPLSPLRAAHCSSLPSALLTPRRALLADAASSATMPSLVRLSLREI
jgi:hypothetical protein